MHSRLIMRVGNPKARDCYLSETATQNWRSRQLERNIRSLYYERLLSSGAKPQALQTVETVEKQTIRDFLKDLHVFEFLDCPESSRASEKDIESNLIEDLQSFLLELGKGFSFVARQNESRLT